MFDITKNIKLLHSAFAQARLRVSKQETIERITNKILYKEDVFEISRVAGLLGIKKASEVIPYAHPLPLEFASITHKIEGLDIIIETEVKSINRADVEVYAVYGASVVAINLYDMLKETDEEMEILSIKAIKRTETASPYPAEWIRLLRVAVMVCSDSIASGKKGDQAGKVINRKLENFNIVPCEYSILSDEITHIQEKVQAHCENNIDLIILSGGTGLSSRDRMPEALRPLLEREIPGIAEAVRSYGQELTPYSMFSRSLAGLKGNTLILALPGSTRGAEESMDALFPYVLHAFKILRPSPL